MGELLTDLEELIGDIIVPHTQRTYEFLDDASAGESRDLKTLPQAESRESNMAEASEGKVSQRSLRRRRRELRHRAQSLVEGATDPWEEVEEYETVIPEGEEDEFIDEETAEVAEEVIEFTYTIRELGAEMILGEDCFA